jgi:hypothetical protein
MEYWNAGKMGREKKTQGVVDKSGIGGNTIKLIPSLSNPTFHYSTIPLFLLRAKQNTLYGFIQFLKTYNEGWHHGKTQVKIKPMDCR